MFGLLLARGLVAVTLSRVADDLPAHAVVGMDLTVLTFTLGLSLLASVIFAAVPALQTTRDDVTETIKEGGRGVSARHRMQQVLVVAEMALALLLTVSAGLMVRTMWSLWQVDPGFDAKGILTFALAGTPSDGSVCAGAARWLHTARGSHPAACPAVGGDQRRRRIDSR